MGPRRAIALLTCCAALLSTAGASAQYSVGSREQIAWVRRAATNFVNAELAGNGAAACGILDASLRATRQHRTCAQRLNGTIARRLSEAGGRARLRAQRTAIASAPVVVHGDVATIGLQAPLMNGPNRFLWTENCWMLQG